MPLHQRGSAPAKYPSPIRFSGTAAFRETGRAEFGGDKNVRPESPARLATHARPRMLCPRLLPKSWWLAGLPLNLARLQKRYDAHPHRLKPAQTEMRKRVCATTARYPLTITQPTGLRFRPASSLTQKIASRPVSRVLSGACAPRRSFVWDVACATPRATNPGESLDRPDATVARAPCSPLFGLAPGEVFRAISIAGNAVGSYSTFSPLPLACAKGGPFSVALSLGLPPAAVSRHRLSMEPGLSSSVLANTRDRPAGWHSPQRLVWQMRQAACQGERPRQPAPSTR